MGWLDSWWKKDDPLSQLDPSLREFLEKNRPEYKPAASTQTTDVDQPTYREQIGIKEPEKKAAAKDDKQQQQESTDPPHATQTLFPDGRYAHLWKTYRPQSELEEAGKSDQEKLLDIVGGYKERQAEVSRAAMENCSNEQWDVTECFRTGGIKSRLTMCRDENRKLSRCIEMQTRFLKALGYASMVARTTEETERIQLHADTLYHRMLDYEVAAAEAKKQGEPVPPLPAFDDPTTTSRGHDQERLTFEQLSPAVQTRLKQEKLEGLEGIELEIAKRELDQSIANNADLYDRVQVRFLEERKERLRRQEEGNERIGDKVKRYFDFRSYEDTEKKK